MPCPEKGVLRAYVDRELPPRQADEVARHVAACGSCASVLAGLENTARLVGAKVELLSPTPADRPLAPAIALAEHRRRMEARTGRWGLRATLDGLRRGLSPARLVAAALPLALVIVLAATPMGLAAQDLLNVFRVQKVATVQIDPSMLPTLPEPEDLGTIDLPSQPELKTSTVADAGRAAGIQPRTLGSVPSGLVADPIVMVSQAVEGSFTYDIEKLKAYYARRGLKGQPPAELDGLTIKGTMPPAVLAVYGDQQLLDQVNGQVQRNDAAKSRGAAKAPAQPGGRFLVLAQAQSPRLEIPGNVDAAKLREELLANGALPPEIAAQLAAIGDWETTLPVPVLKGTSREVAVDGVRGVLVTGDHQGRYLIWQKGGVLYGLFGTVSEAELLGAAGSLK